MALEADTIESEMTEDWAKIREKYAVEQPEPEPEPVEPVAQATEATPEPRARDESGKFVKQEKAPEKPEISIAEPPAAARPESESLQRDVNQAPSTWKPAARLEFDKLSPSVKAEIHRREQDFLNGQSQVLPDAKFGKEVRAVIEPYRMLIEAEGGTPERAIADLLRTAATFRVGTPQQKLQALAAIAQQFNVDVRPLVNQPAQGQPQPDASNRTLSDPRVDQLLQQMALRDQQSAQQEQQQREATVTAWMGEMKDGKPLRPYVGDVINQMSALVPQIRESNPLFSHVQVLQQAYEMATWGNPEIRPLLQQPSQGSTQVREADNQNRVREARRAASVNVPRRASLPTPGKPESMEKTIEETARALGLLS